jgi:non-ribosomal peptide synthetase component F
VLTIYDALVEGKAPPLIDLPFQYADYARWRRQNMETHEFAQHRDYWRRRMEGASPLALPFSRAPSVARTAGRHQVPLALDGSLFDRIEELARVESVSHFVVIAAALLAFLGRIAETDDVSLLALSGAAQQEAPELASLIGCFLDFLVIRAELKHDLTFRTLLWHVRERVTEAQIHGTVSAAVVVDEPGVFDQPYARVLLNVLDEWPATAQEFGHLKTEATALRFGPRVTELAWSVLLPFRRAVLMVSSDTFDLDAAQRLARGLASLLTHAITEPDVALARLRVDS